MATAIAKVCKLCGTDVSAAKRLKNALGEYFCQPCSESFRSNPTPPTPQPAASSSLPTPPSPTIAASEPARVDRPELDRVDRLRPGEQDCFFDAAMLGLLRRQAEPDDLLMACDVRQPRSQTRRTMLLTPTRLIFVGVTNQNGQRRIIDRRELVISEIDQISEMVAQATLFSKECSVIQIATRDGIESWTTIHSLGRRIAEAVQAIKCGEAVLPFLRCVEDMATVTVSGTPLQSTNLPASNHVSPWANRFVIPPLRSTESRLLVLGIFVASICILAPAALSCFIGLLMLACGDFKELGLLLLLLILGSAASIPSYANACFALGRLGAMGLAKLPTDHPAPTPSASPRITFRMPRPAIPWALLAQIILPVAILGGTGWWGYSYYTTEQAKLTPLLPKITVTGMAANAVVLSDWKVNTIQLSGVVQFTGQTGVELHYKITDNGVTQSTGVIDPPAGGTLIISRDPMRVQIMLPSRPTPTTEVEITALGG